MPISKASSPEKKKVLASAPAQQAPPPPPKPTTTTATRTPPTETAEERQERIKAAARAFALSSSPQKKKAASTPAQQAPPPPPKPTPVQQAPPPPRTTTRTPPPTETAEERQERIKAAARAFALTCVGKRLPKPKPTKPKRQIVKEKKKVDKNAKWMKQYQALKDFQEVHGHCRFPRRKTQTKEDQALSTWLQRQNAEYIEMRKTGIQSSDYLTRERMDLLESIPTFEWHLSKAELWNTRYQQLIDYKTEFGDCLVPQLYVIPNTRVTLGKWVQLQRNQYEQLRRGREDKSTLTPERLYKLVKIGFVWKCDTSKRPRREFNKTLAPIGSTRIGPVSEAAAAAAAKTAAAVAAKTESSSKSATPSSSSSSNNNKRKKNTTTTESESSSPTGKRPKTTMEEKEQDSGNVASASGPL